MTDLWPPRANAARISAARDGRRSSRGRTLSLVARGRVSLSSTRRLLATAADGTKRDDDTRAFKSSRRRRDLRLQNDERRDPRQRAARRRRHRSPSPLAAAARRRPLALTRRASRHSKASPLVDTRSRCCCDLFHATRRATIATSHRVVVTTVDRSTTSTGNEAGRATTIELRLASRASRRFTTTTIDNEPKPSRRLTRKIDKPRGRAACCTSFTHTRARACRNVTTPKVGASRCAMCGGEQTATSVNRVMSARVTSAQIAASHVGGGGDGWRR